MISFRSRRGQPIAQSAEHNEGDDVAWQTGPVHDVEVDARDEGVGPTQSGTIVDLLPSSQAGTGDRRPATGINAPRQIASRAKTEEARANNEWPAGILRPNQPTNRRHLHRRSAQAEATRRWLG
jgi:hypothetical protein